MLRITRDGGGERPVNLPALARRTGISRRYLEQLVMPLQRAGLLRGCAGRSGGQMLARRPADIGLRDIVDAAREDLAIVRCVDDPECCPRAGDCESRVLWELLTLRIRSVLDEYTLADLADVGALRGEVDEERRRLQHPSCARSGRRRERGGR
jgi:Rrf2 family protein